MTGRLLTLMAVLLAVAGPAMLSSPASLAKGSRSEATLMVIAVFRDGEWQPAAGETKILPCASPRPHHGRNILDIRVRGRDQSGTEVFSRRFPNPRIRYIEGDRGGPKLIEKTRFVLHLPATKATETIEFLDPTTADGFDRVDPEAFKGSLAKMKPNFVLDVGKQMRAFAENPPDRDKAPCREIEYMPGKEIEFPADKKK